MDILATKRTYQLSLVKTYVAKWGPVQAIRELIQNALDSDSPFRYEFNNRAEDGTWTLKLNSEFSTLQAKTLLLGATNKGDNKGAIGSFGEGYKLAMLVLTRVNMPMRIINNDKIWTPRFRNSKQFGEEVLVVDETDANDRLNKGVTFIVEGIDDEMMIQIQSSCLQMQPMIGEIKTTSYGDILLEQKGKLYVGGLFICETQFTYGYNIKPGHIVLERDRQTVADWKMAEVTLKMLIEVFPAPHIAEMISKDLVDVNDARYGMPDLVKDECYRLFRRMHPRAIIASSYSDMKEKIEQGLTKTVYGGGGMHYAVSTHAEYQEELARMPSAPKRDTPKILLQYFYEKNKDEFSSKLTNQWYALLDQADNWQLK